MYIYIYTNMYIEIWNNWLKCMLVIFSHVGLPLRLVFRRTLSCEWSDSWPTGPWGEHQAASSMYVHVRLRVSASAKRVQSLLDLPNIHFSMCSLHGQVYSVMGLSGSGLGCGLLADSSISGISVMRRWFCVILSANPRQQQQMSKQEQVACLHACIRDTRILVGDVPSPHKI